MQTTSIAPRIRIMHAPKNRYCVYSQDTISKGEIAISIAPELSRYSSSWLALSSLEDIVQGVSTLTETQEAESLPDVHEFVVGGVYTNDTLTAHNTGNCAVCLESTVGDTILHFSDNQRKDPCIHLFCVSEFIDQLMQVPVEIPSEELIANRI